MELHETPLPGLGTRFDFVTRKGEDVGVVVHHDGRRDVFLCAASDPDRPVATFSLDADESATLASMLGADHIGDRLRSAMTKIEELNIEWLELPADSPYVNRPMGDTCARTRTGVSIVAIVRGEHAEASPGPTYTLNADDWLVVVGTAKGIRELSEHLGA